MSLILKLKPVIGAIASMSLALPLMAYAQADNSPIRIGAIGDSMTDEYLDSGTNANTDIAAYNWVEILAKLRGEQFDWGELRPSLDQPWPDHRAAGFQYNYAKVAATASRSARMTLDFWLFDYDMPIDSSAVGSRYVADQLPGLLSEKVDYAVVAAGSNDYFFKTHKFNLLGTPKRNDVTPDEAFNTEVASDLLTYVDKLQAQGSKVLLAYIPMGTAGGADEAVLSAIAHANTLLEKGAAERNVPMVRLFDFAKNPDGGVTVGNINVAYGTIAKEADLLPAAQAQSGKCRSDGLCAGPTHSKQFIADDELHPNTLVQALMANQIIKALNQGYGLQLTPLTHAEMLSLVP